MTSTRIRKTSAHTSAPATNASASISRSSAERLLATQERPDLLHEIRVALGEHLPVELLGLAREARPEVDVLDSGFVLHLLLLAVLRLAPPGPFLLRPYRDLRQALALRLFQRLPLVVVDEDRHRGADEARPVAVFGVFVPAEVGDAPQRPAVAVDRVALERGVHLGRRHAHRDRAERLEERVVDRRRAQAETVEARALRGLRGVDVEAHAVRQVREVPG